jgi:aminopeptidase N
MMVNDASVGEDFVTSLTVHEVSHTYFPFMMGINEQEFAWMDEGWAAFFDYNLADSMSHGKEGNTRGYGRSAGTDSDVPPMVRTSNLRGAAYGIESYQRPQAAYLQLKDLLGYETFHKCMIEYTNRWKGKHPIPLDFFNTWNEASGQNLNWFWKPWFYEFGYPDIAIGNVERPSDFDADVITLVKKGNIPTSIHLELEYADGTKQTIHQTAIMWRNGNTELRVFGQPGKSLTSVKLGQKQIPDADQKNNTWKKNG